MKRVVKDELLDEMDQGDPAAIRSRRDLRMINAIMGGERWILKELRGCTGVSHCIEVGAGEGKLSESIKAAFPEMRVSALDRIVRPEGLADGVEWLQEDVMNLGDVVEMDGSVAVVANLFVHHFEDDELRWLFRSIEGAGVVLLSEPYRSWWSKLLGYSVYPLINDVTRNDMMISIEAGFVLGELSDLVGDGWECEEVKSFFGGAHLRGLGVKR